MANKIKEGQDSLAEHVAMPYLNTTFVEYLTLLEKKFLECSIEINAWFARQWEIYLPPVYGSVDLRNAGFKIAPIDMNLFPAGFNNLNSNFLPLSKSAAKKILQKISSDAKRILIIPESHTRNIFYWSNIKTLQRIIESAGFEVRLSSLSEDISQALKIDLPDGEYLLVESLQRENNKLYVKDFYPDIVLLNNDLSDGIPIILQNVQQKIIPPPELGWSQRLKSKYFQYYAQVANEFAQFLKIDAWLIAPLFRYCDQIDFMQQSGTECLVTNAEILFAEIREKYAQYDIPYDPFLIVKADAGTYGMAVMTIHDPSELKSLNRKQRTRMSSTKGGQPVNRVIIQEGVYTFETFRDEKAVAEPVIYLWGDVVVGGFYRMHTDRGINENLNTPGMRFKPIAFTQDWQEPDLQGDTGIKGSRFHVYGVLAQLGVLAAAREIKGRINLS